MTKQILTKENIAHIKEHIQLYESANIYGNDILTSSWYLNQKLDCIKNCNTLYYTGASFDVKINGIVYNMSHITAELRPNGKVWINLSNKGLTQNAHWKLYYELEPIFEQEFKRLDKHKKVAYNKFIKNFKSAYKKLQEQMKINQNYLKDYKLEV